jgi:urease subunit gamma/beta
MLQAARSGADYAGVKAAGRAAVAPDDVMPGVRELVDEVRLEVLMGDGTRLVVLVDPLGSADPSTESDGAGSIRPAEAASEGPVHMARDTIELTVTSDSRRVIRVSSHYPFDRVNARLVFDRAAARGYRLDLPAGASERWAPAEMKTVRLIRFERDAFDGAGSTVDGAGNTEDRS